MNLPDFFIGIGDLLTGSALQAGALWVLTNVPGFPPIIQTVHILGIAAVMGTAVLLNLRILGVAVPSQNITEMTARIAPLLYTALISNVISGSFFVFGRPARYFNNPVFAWKMLFLLAAVSLLIYFMIMHKKAAGYWEQEKNKWSGRTLAIVSLGLWLMVSLAGRWIAYLEHLQYPIWSF